MSHAQTHENLYKVVSGKPTAEELAVIVALLSSLGGIRELTEPTKLNKWGDPQAHLRQPIAKSRQAWRLSAWASR